MKTILFLFCVMASCCLCAQKTSIKTISGGFILNDLTENVYGYTYTKGKSPDEYSMAIKPGYATQVFKADSILKLDVPTYTVNLLHIDPVDNTKFKKKLIFDGFTDANRQIRVIENYGTPNMSLAQITTSQYENIIREKLFKHKFNIQPDDDLFTQKKIDADFLIKGEILECKSESKGTPGFIMSIVIKWTIYDVAKEEAVLRITTGGYSNNRRKLFEHEVLKLALEDATGGLIVNKDLLNLLAVGVTASQDGKALQSIVSKRRNSNENYTENSKQATIKLSSNSGSGYGFLISPDGYLIAPAPTVSDPTELQGTFQNGLSLPVKVISIDNKTNMALCKVLGKGYSSFSIDTVAAVNKIGKEVMLVDINAAGEQSFVKGTVLSTKQINNMMLIQTDLKMINNAVLLLGKQGELMGVISTIKEAGSSEMAIPVKEILKSLNVNLVQE
jgi:hypothetical protein